MTRRAAYGLHSPEVAAWYREMAFASACSMRIASYRQGDELLFCQLCLSVLHADCMIGVKRIQLGSYLCLSVLHADCIFSKSLTPAPASFFVSACSMRIASRAPGINTAWPCTLSQRAPCGLHQQKCTNEHKICCGIRCEQVDSFSVMRN